MRDYANWTYQQTTYRGHTATACGNDKNDCPMDYHVTIDDSDEDYDLRDYTTAPEPSGPASWPTWREAAIHALIDHLFK